MLALDTSSIPDRAERGVHHRQERKDIYVCHVKNIMCFFRCSSSLVVQDLLCTLMDCPFNAQESVVLKSVVPRGSQSAKLDQSSSAL
jgi:hypothetical protein